MLPLINFFVPETAFRRNDFLNTDIRGQDPHQHGTQACPAAASEASSNLTSPNEITGTLPFSGSGLAQV